MEKTKEEKDIEFQKKIETCPEYELYFIIDECGSFLWTMNRGINKGNIHNSDGIQEDMRNVREIQEKAFRQTTRFGVTIYPNKEGIEKLGNYKKWYNHWYDWKKGLSDTIWETVNKKLSTKESITEFLPKNGWNDISRKVLIEKI